MRGLVVAAVAAAAAVPAVASAKPFAQRTAPSKRTTTAPVVPRSILARAPSFGTVRHTSSAPLTATHVEVMKTPPSSVTDRHVHGNELGKYLAVRGGYAENMGGSAEWDSCTAYATVGIVNLLPADDQEDVGKDLARHLEEELLPTSSHVDDGAEPKLICLPSDGGEPSALIGTFSGSLDGSTSDASTLASYETIGTVSDAIFILIKEGDENDNDAAMNGIASVLQGLARKVGGDSNNDSKPRLVVYIQTHADHQGYVRYLLRSALAKLSEDDSKSKWDSISRLQSDVDVVVLPYSAENVAEMAATGKMFASHRQNDAPQAVPLSSFETLATQVYQALARSAAAGIDFFHAASSVTGTVESGIDELSDSEAFAESGAVGEMDYDDAPSELESEDLVEYDDISVEAESVLVDGEEPPKETARPSPPDAEMILAELTGASRRILLECERKMGDLEAKQDEFLLNSDQGMPILEFGSDAQRIIEYAATSFEEIAADATGTAEVDDSIQAQIQEMKMSLFMDVAGDSGLRHLFEIQLQSLREYYGRRYEAVLDEILGSSSEGGESRSKEKQEAILTAAAQRAAEGFRTAAGNAMPSSCREGSILECLDFGIVITRDLNGLMQDMIEATQARRELEEDWDNAATGEVGAENDKEEGPADDNGGRQTRRQRKGPAKWYEKIAARALVLGVNYLQGWLALQQLRKAAADRDKAMPKFPLF